MEVVYSNDEENSFVDRSKPQYNDKFKQEYNKSDLIHDSWMEFNAQYITTSAKSPP